MTFKATPRISCWENDRRFTYKNIVTKESISYFRDNAPFIPDGKTAEVEEYPYPFIFAVWIRHTDDGADYGLPACKDFDKVDEANVLGSHLHDNIHKLIESPVVIAAAGELIPIVGATADEDGNIFPHDPRLHWMAFKADPSKGQVAVFDLASTLKIRRVASLPKRLLSSFMMTT